MLLHHYHWIDDHSRHNIVPSQHVLSCSCHDRSRLLLCLLLDHHQFLQLLKHPQRLINRSLVHLHHGCILALHRMHASL